MAWTTAGSRSGMGGYELHDQLSEPFFRPAGGYVANFSRSVDSNSEEIYSRQVLYSSYTSRITWKGLDADHSRVFITDMKHPGDKIGNDVWCDLPEPALKIALSMPKTKDRAFPYHSDTISAAFTRACKFLGIEDLRFHDLRHEGVTRLFETGLSIPQVAAVSGHRSWSSLQRYTHIKQTGDKYEDWEWIDRLASHSY